MPVFTCLAWRTEHQKRFPKQISCTRKTWIRRNLSDASENEKLGANENAKM